MSVSAVRRPLRSSTATADPTGLPLPFWSSTVEMSSWLRPSITDSVPLISLETQAREPSGAQATACGWRSTRKFAPTGSRLVSITETELLVSVVT